MSTNGASLSPSFSAFAIRSLSTLTRRFTASSRLGSWSATEFRLYRRRRVYTQASPWVLALI